MAEQEKQELSEEDKFAAFLGLEDKPEEKPDPDPEPQKTEAAEKTETPTEKPEEPFPGFSALSEPVRKAYEDAQEKLRQAEQRAQEHEQRFRQRDEEFRALHGQHAPTQKKLAELERQLKERDTQIATARPLEKWQKQKTDLPEESEAFEQLVEGNVNPLREKVGTLESTVEELRQENARLQHAYYVERQQAALDRYCKQHEYPDWRDTIKPENKDFWDWALDANNPLLDDDDRQAIGPNGYDAMKYAKVLTVFHREKERETLRKAQVPKTDRREKAKADVDPDPSKRQSPQARANGATSDYEAGYAAFLEREGIST